MNKPILECNGIAAGYVKDLDILQGVDLVVNQNEIVSIIGNTLIIYKQSENPKNRHIKI